MKTIFFVLVALCLTGSGFGQKIDIRPYYIGERVFDLPLQPIIHYKDSAASLSSFGDKLIILDFWNVHCSSCIAMFPKEDSLQRLLPNDLQFVLVTSDKKKEVLSFLKKYNKTHPQLSLPIVIADRVLHRLFRFSYVPHYVWIAPNGLILAQTSDNLINKGAIVNALKPFRKEEARLKGNKYADFNLHLQKPSTEEALLLKLLNN
jgi:thiol-disulfide isomerase/thioredoxin